MAVWGKKINEGVCRVKMKKGEEKKGNAGNVRKSIEYIPDKHFIN